MIVTLDASVWLASLLVDEPAHRSSNAAVTVLQQGGPRLIQPPLFLVEVAATVARRTGQPARGLDARRRCSHWRPWRSPGGLAP